LFDAKAAVWSAKYATGGVLISRMVRFGAALEEYAPTAGRVLDLGCGTGHLAYAAAAAGMRVTGCDISLEMLRRASAQDVGGAIEWLQLETGWSKLPFGTATFNAIIASSVLEYVDNPDTVLGECARVLSPGGILVCTVPNLIHPLRWMEWAARLLTLVPWALAAGQRWSGLNSYLVYLQISQHRHMAGWWSAAAAQHGLQDVPCATGNGARSPLRLLAFQRSCDHRKIPLNRARSTSRSKMASRLLRRAVSWRSASLDPLQYGTRPQRSLVASRGTEKHVISPGRRLVDGIILADRPNSSQALFHLWAA
jgi:SAM-dependent methyltransferase